MTEGSITTGDSHLKGLLTIYEASDTSSLHYAISVGGVVQSAADIPVAGEVGGVVDVSGGLPNIRVAFSDPEPVRLS